MVEGKVTWDPCMGFNGGILVLNMWIARRITQGKELTSSRSVYGRSSRIPQIDGSF